MKNNIITGFVAFGLGLSSAYFLGFFNSNSSSHFEKANNSSFRSNASTRSPSSLSKNVRSWNQTLKQRDVAVFTKELQEKLTNPELNEPSDLVYKAVLSPLFKLKGILWRSAHVAEQFQSFHIASIAALRRFHQNLRIRPDHIKTWTTFFTLPNSEENLAPFASLRDVQNVYLKDLAPAIDQSIDQIKDAIEQITNSQQGGNPVVLSLDVSLLYGSSKVYRAKGKNYFDVTLADLHVLKAYMLQVQSTALYLVSYNFDSLNELLHTASTNFRKDSFAGHLKAKGSRLAYLFNKPFPSVQDFHRELHKSSGRRGQGRYASLFTIIDGQEYKGLLRSEKAPHTLTASKEYLKLSYESKRVAYNLLSNHPEHKQRFNSFAYFFNETVNDLTGQRISMMLDILNETGGGEYSLEDPLLAQSTSIAFTEIYNLDNPNIKDLKKMVATPSEYNKKPWLKDHNEKKYKNYHHGTKDRLPSSTLGGVFPKTNSYDELLKAREIVQRSQVGVPLTFWMEMFL